MFWLGGTEPGARGVTARAANLFPRLSTLETYSPPPAPLEAMDHAEIQRRIRRARPHVLLVSFGCPKQEKWIMANKHRLGVPVSIGVGGSFEMACGFAKRAPKIMQELGLEWAFRLLQDAARLYERYILKDIPFLIKLLRRTIVETIARTH